MIVCLHVDDITVAGESEACDFLNICLLEGFQTFYLFFSSLISLIADGPHHYHLSPVHALQLFIAMRVQHSYNSSTNGLSLLTHVPTLSVTKERTQILLR